MQITSFLQDGQYGLGDERPGGIGGALAGQGQGFAAAACVLLTVVLALECRRLLRQAARPDAYEAVEFQEV